MKIINAGVFCLLFAAAAVPAQAQMAWTDQGFVNVTGGAQVGSQTLTVTTPFTIYGEEGEVASALDVKGGGFFDISAGYKVWRNLAIGLGYSYTSGSSDAAIAATVPDPLVFDQLRSASTTAGSLDHTEQAVHLTGTWMVPVTDKIDVALAFGPTFFSVSQDVPNGVQVTEPGPSISQVDVQGVDESAVGFHLGVDVTYLLTPRIGVGGLARYTRGSIDIANSPDGLDVGGLQVGGGVRIRF